ncbi:hypothetical protein CK203_008990 [Vitis vinifera]|uniref:Uncharacterized protein n=1 Tax=Vitis vinifera TaxID=29760 RepID=A0A438K2I4_VITVI|nr:hypothetical protein CK203_008990 [Vitis vinifera]
MSDILYVHYYALISLCDSALSFADQRPDLRDLKGCYGLYRTFPIRPGSTRAVWGDPSPCVGPTARDVMLLMKEAMLLTAETGKQVMACPGSTCIGGDFVGSTCTEEEEGQQLEGRKTGQHMHLGFFWAAHALEEILGAAHAFGFFLGSTCIGGDFVGSTCTEEEEGQQLGGGRKRAAAGRVRMI